MTKRLPPEVKKFFESMGRKGGKKAAASMTADQRARRARKAARARWSKKKDPAG